MSYEQGKFTGYAALNVEQGKALDLVKHEYSPKQWNELDVDIKISACGICGSCIHTLTSGWGATKYPCVAGHEVVGTIVKAGSKSGHSVGSRVGVGAQSGSCLECEYCKKDLPQYCAKGMVGTYNGKWEDGSTSMGGYADYIRCRGAFAVKIPEQLSDEQAAPMMCAGITTYHPLKRFGAGPGKRVGIVGIGGLGHYGLQWAKAMGAETVAISHSDSKREDAKKMGADDFIVAKDINEVVKKHSRTFDLILITAFGEEVPMDTLYLPMLKPEGTACLVALPETKLPAYKPTALIGKGVTIAGSLIGGPAMIAEMLQFAVDHKVQSWVQTRPMSEASQAVKDMHAGKARYRFVLKN